MKDLLKILNRRQQEAVTAALGPILVLAGAGSGKTRVLTYRIAYLLEEKLFRPEEILALTFTNKAAGEMRNRIIGLIGKSEKRNAPVKLPIMMGTFHSVCARLLRHDIEKLGSGYSRNFVIYDSDDSQHLIKQIMLELNLTERVKPQAMSYFISAAKNRLIEPKALSLESPFLQKAVQTVGELYQTRLREHNALDFDDLLKVSYELLVTVPGVLKKYQQRFRYVLVDEYQDTNHVQYMFLKLLVKKHRNLFVVGDDAQSIYGFRGANLQNILNFQKDYPKAQIIKLEQNYRSTQVILDAASKVLRLNPAQYEKKLWTESRGGSKIILYEAHDEADEGRFVLQHIVNPEGNPLAKSAELMYTDDEGRIIETGSATSNDAPEYGDEAGDSGQTPILDSFFNKLRPGSSLPFLGNFQFSIPKNLRETVILYRTHAQSRAFEEVFLSAGIPYQIIGGIKFYERKEIKDLLAYLRLVINPRDLVSLGRIINTPARGLGTASLRLLTEALRQYDFSFTRLGRNLAAVGLSAKAQTGAREFFELLARASTLPKSKSLLELMHLLTNRSGLKDSLLDGSKEGEARWENVEELFNVAARFKNLPWAEGLQAFLEEVALMTDLDTMEETENKLTLMTLHSAKGLEFETVFFVGLEEGLLPHSRSLLSPQETAEEVRLAYVGMTRAKKRLYLSYARQRQIFGEIRRSVPSRIIKAIPKKLIDKIKN